MSKTMSLEDLMQSLAEAQEVLGNLDGELTSVVFDPTDPASIEAAIQSMEEVIDERVGYHADNPIVAPLVVRTKERFRQAILDKAAAACATGDEG